MFNVFGTENLKGFFLNSVQTLKNYSVKSPENGDYRPYYSIFQNMTISEMELPGE